jgi:NAD(P)-dependent dehydrogenase (short-subunit alcohol dehydrogenase family)
VSNRFDGQHALVTGGGSGIGLACAAAFLSEGARVTILGRTESKLDDAVKELGGGDRVARIATDVSDEGAVADAVKQAHASAPLTIAVANAGTGGIAPLAVTEDKDWQQILDVNLNGTFYTFKHAGQAIADAGGGAMCAISSIAGVRTHRFMHAYCASKAAIDMLVRTSADEIGAQNVRVNSVCPGLVDTDIAAGLFATDVVHQDYLDCMPMGRTGVPEDIANAVRFLCSPEATWITGVNLSVDGGHHLRRGPNYDAFFAPPV